jgi:aspartyl/asparaginyl-tRNA synthetase
MLPNFGAQADIINEVTFADVIVDEKEMLGKTVMIPGVMINLGDTNFLYEYAGTMTALTIVTKNLSKEQKKMVIKKCSSGCYVEVEGVVNKNKTIMATKITKMGLMDKLMNIAKGYLSIFF